MPGVRPDLEALRGLLGLDGSGSPTGRARQAVALIRHPHTPWTVREGAGGAERLGAVLVSPLALGLRGTAWEGLLAHELTGRVPGPAGYDRDLAERARLLGTSIPRLVTALAPLLGLFDDPPSACEGLAADHVQILFPELHESIELWSRVVDEPAADADGTSRAAVQDRATARVVDSLTPSGLAVDDAAAQIGRFRAAQVLLGEAWMRISARHEPLEGWSEWAALVAGRLATVRGAARAASPDSSVPLIDAAPSEPGADPSHALSGLFEAYGNEPISPTTQHPGTGLLRYLRCGFRYWHVWGTYSQLYDALLAAQARAADEPSTDAVPILDPSHAKLLADHVRHYLYIGHDTGRVPVVLPELTELPLSGWEVRTLFPGLAALMVPGSSTVVGAAAPAVIGEIAELLALAADEGDLSRAMVHLGGGTEPSAPGSWRTWLSELSAEIADRLTLTRREAA